MPPTLLYKNSDPTVLFLLQAVVERYRDVVRRELPHIHMHSRGSGLFAEYVKQVEALAWLERQWLGCYPNAPSTALTWPEHFGSLTTIGSSLIFSKRFVWVTCPVCGATCSPESTQVIEFHEGEALAAYGGRRLLCPQGHLIFTLGEWTS